MCLFFLSLHRTPAEHPSLPDLHPPPWFCPCVLYTSSCNPLSSLSPPHSPLAIVRLFLTSMCLVIFCFLFSSIDYVHVMLLLGPSLHWDAFFFPHVWIVCNFQGSVQLPGLPLSFLHSTQSTAILFSEIWYLSMSSYSLWCRIVSLVIFSCIHHRLKRLLVDLIDPMYSMNLRVFTDSLPNSNIQMRLKTTAM